RLAIRPIPRGRLAGDPIQALLDGAFSPLKHHPSRSQAISIKNPPSRDCLKINVSSPATIRPVPAPPFPPPQFRKQLPILFEYLSFPCDTPHLPPRSAPLRHLHRKSPHGEHTSARWRHSCRLTHPAQRYPVL